MAWTKREIIPVAADMWSDIWDGDGWQINKAKDSRPEPYILIDTVMPSWVPASSIMGSFFTLEEAQAEAAKLGKPDWSDTPTDEEFYGEAAPPHQ